MQPFGWFALPTLGLGATLWCAWNRWNSFQAPKHCPLSTWSILKESFVLIVSCNTFPILKQNQQRKDQEYKASGFSTFLFMSLQHGVPLISFVYNPIAWWTLQNHHFGQSQVLELRPPSMSCWPKLVGVSKNSSQRRTKETQINKITTFYASLTIKQSYIINGSKEMPIFLWYCWFRNQPDDTVDTVGSGNPRLLPCFTGVQKHPKWLAGPPDEVSLGVWG